MTSINHHLHYYNQLTILIAFAVLILSLVTLRSDFPLDQYYEYLFFGFGHISQFVYCYLFMAALIILSNYHSRFLYALKVILLTHVSFAAMALLYFMRPDITSYKAFFTHQMNYVAVSPLLLILLMLYERNNVSFAHFDSGKYYFFIAILLFLLGGLLGLNISSSTTVIPAHYHGSIVSITIALMGVVLFALSQSNLIQPTHKLIKLLPIAYGSGQMLHIIGLALSGGYGALRKSPELVTETATRFWLGIMGFGGLIAICAGFIFVYLVVVALFHLLRRGNPSSKHSA